MLTRRDCFRLGLGSLLVPFIPTTIKKYEYVPYHDALKNFHSKITTRTYRALDQDATIYSLTMPFTHQCKCGWTADGLRSTFSVTRQEVNHNCLDQLQDLILCKRRLAIVSLKDIFNEYLHTGKVRHAYCPLEG